MIKIDLLLIQEHQERRACDRLGDGSQIEGSVWCCWYSSLTVSQAETLLPKNLFTLHHGNGYRGNGGGFHPFLNVLSESDEIQCCLGFRSGLSLAIKESWHYKTQQKSRCG
jgi:hypothetical protein